MFKEEDMIDQELLMK